MRRRGIEKDVTTALDTVVVFLPPFVDSSLATRNRTVCKVVGVSDVLQATLTVERRTTPEYNRIILIWIIGRSHVLVPVVDRSATNSRSYPPLVHLSRPFPVRIQNSLKRHPTKVLRHTFNVFVKHQRILIVRVQHLVRRHSPLPEPVLRIHQKIPHITCIWRRPDDTRPLFIRLANAACPKSMMTGERLPSRRTTFPT
ncbi:hypothetical protein EDD85DRAFT_152906 [Armillaria nabsnona]|nr:hypothetical protein EDD85DRAFT_152906 [Armillaria nabsnona]